MNAYYFEKVNTLVYPKVEIVKCDDGKEISKRILTITYLYVVHPVQLNVNTTISAGDGWLDICHCSTSKKKDDTICINDEALHIGPPPTTKKELDNLSFACDPWYDDNNHVEVRTRDMYVSEDYCDRLPEHRTPTASLRSIVGSAERIFRGEQYKPNETESLIRDYIIARCSEALGAVGRCNIKGNLYVKYVDGSICIGWDDDMFKSIGELLYI